MKLLLYNHQCMEYRIPLYGRLASSVDGEARFCFDGGLLHEASAQFTVVNGRAKSLAWNARIGRPMEVYLSFGLLRELWQYRPDVIVIEDGSNVLNNLIVYFLRPLIGARLVLWGVGDIPHRSPSIYKRLAQPFIHYLWRKANAIVAYSSYSKQVYRRQGVPEESIFIAQNAIELGDVNGRIAVHRQHSPLIDRLKRRQVVLYLGRLAATKHPLDMVAIAQHFQAKGRQDIVIAIVGSGPQEAELRSRIQQLELQNCMLFPGTSLEAASEYLAFADVCVVPGEGGLAYNHALQHGVPVVATGGDGTEYDLIRPGQNGFLVERGDIPGLVRAIEQILENSQIHQTTASTIKSLPTIDTMVQAFLKAIAHATGSSYNPRNTLTPESES